MDYIDRDKLKSMTVQKNSIWDSITDSQGRGLSEIIDSIPTIEVVPCMNCKMWEQNQNLPYGNCSYHLSLAYATDWCSWAERREDAQIH